MDTKAQVRALNDLLDTARDGQHGFEKAMEETDDTALKTAFEAARKDCLAAAEALETRIRELGGRPDNEGTTLGSLHRSWIDIRSALQKDDRKAVLHEVVRGERHAVKEYEDAIEKDWPPAMQEFLARQKRGAEANLERFEALAP